MAADHTDGPWIDTVETEGEDKRRSISASRGTCCAPGALPRDYVRKITAQSSGA